MSGLSQTMAHFHSNVIIEISLWPERLISTIVMLGLTDNEMRVTCKAVDKAVFGSCLALEQPRFMVHDIGYTSDTQYIILKNKKQTLKGREKLALA